MLGANCIYFKPTDSGGVCKHPDMRRGFWIFSYEGNCILTHDCIYLKSECILKVPKFKPDTPRKTKIPAPIKKPVRKAHIHKHIHKHKEK